MNVYILNAKILSFLLLCGSQTSVRWSYYTPWAGFGYFFFIEVDWPQKKKTKNKKTTDIDISCDEKASSVFITL